MRLQLAVRNDWTWSEDFGDAGDGVWTKTRTTITDNAVAAPNGTTTADKLVEDSSPSATHFLQRNAPTHTDNTDQTVSGFIKSAERVALRFDLLNKAGNSYVVDFQMSTATKAEVSGTGTSTFRDVGNGWYRFSITQDSESGGSTPRLNIVLKSGGVITYNGDGSSGAYVWGLQFEVDRSSVGGYASTEAAAFLTTVGPDPALVSIEISDDAQEHKSSVDLVWQAIASDLSIDHGDTVVVDSDGTTQFVGQITNIRRFRQPSDGDGAPFVRAVCRGYDLLMGDTPIDEDNGAVYRDQSGRDMIQDIFTVSGLSTLITSADATVEEVLTSREMGFAADQTVLSAIDLIAAREGAVWWLDPNVAPADQVAFNYTTEANAAAAAYAISDDPNFTTTFPAESLDVETFFDRPGNLIRVVGGQDTFGRIVTATASDATSQSTYGVKFRRFSSPNITTVEQATDVAAALLAIGKDPQPAGSLSSIYDGLKVGTLIPITDSKYGLTAEDYLIQTISTKQIGGSDETRYRVRVGANRINENRTLRRIESLSQGSNAAPLLLRGINVTGTNGFFIVNTGTTTLEDLYQDASGGITISAWVRSDTTITDYGGILTAAASSEAEDDGWSFNIESGGGVRFLRFQAGTASTHLSYKYASNFPEADGLWHHCLVTWNGITGTSPDSDVKIYFDGVESTTRTSHGVGSWVQDVSANMSMGPVKDMGLAQICAWNIELGDGDIQRLAARPDSTIPTSIFPSHRICYYTLDGYADAVTIPKAVGEIQDRWNDFHAETDVTTSGDFGTGEDSHWTPLL